MTELLDHLALNFRYGDPQIDLVAAPNRDGIHHLVACSRHGVRSGIEQPARNGKSGLRIHRCIRRACQDHAIGTERFDPDIAIRNRLADRIADAVQVAFHREVEARNLAAFGVEKEDAGLADLDTDHVGAASRADDGIGNGGIGDKDVLGVARQVDDHRLADAEIRGHPWRRAAGR